MDRHIHIHLPARRARDAEQLWRAYWKTQFGELMSVPMGEAQAKAMAQQKGGTARPIKSNTAKYGQSSDARDGQSISYKGAKLVERYDGRWDIEKFNSLWDIEPTLEAAKKRVDSGEIDRRQKEMVSEKNKKAAYTIGDPPSNAPAYKRTWRLFTKGDRQLVAAGVAESFAAAEAAVKAEARKRGLSLDAEFGRLTQAERGELVNLYHLARVPLSGQKSGRYERMLWASKEFAKAHPPITSTGAYKELERLIS